MPVIQDPDMLQLDSPELYNVWKGQLYIQEHLACNIKFKSSSTCSIPAQLSSKLEIKNVIQLSELRRALPVQIFDQINFTGREVYCQSIYYTFYAVRTSNINGFEFNKLQEWMKQQKLALIKVLNGQGFLILLTSSAFKCSKDLSVKDSFQLFALILFPHTKLLHNTGRENLGYKFVREDISLKITELLPGLQYAILETRQMQKGKVLFPNALVEQHFKQFSSLQQKAVGIRELRAEPSDTSSLSSGHGKDIPDECDKLSFSRLKSYFSSPVNFSVPLVKMSSLLKEEIPVSSDSEKCGNKMKDSIVLESKIPLLAANKIKSGSSSGNSVLNENKKQPTKKKTFKKGGRRTRRGKKKHMQQTSPSLGATCENQVSNKKRKLNDGEQQQEVPSNRTTLKLASAPSTHRRKRGAEVLTAEFVTDDQVSETETLVTNRRKKEQGTVLKTKITTGKQKKLAPAEDAYVVRERPPKRKASYPGYWNKLPEVKGKAETLRRTPRHQEPSGRQSGRTVETINVAPFEPVGSFSKSSPDLSISAEQSTPLVPEIDLIEKRMNLYESHALNLLADLALNSLSSSSMSYLKSESAAAIKEPEALEKVPNVKENAVEYTQNDCSSPLQSNTTSEEPVQAPDGVESQPKFVSDVGQVQTTTQPRTDNSEKQASHKVLIAAAKAKARNNATSKICLEHSYSQLPIDDVPDKSSKELSEKTLQSVSEPTVTSPNNEVVVEQSSDLFLPRELLLTTSDDECSSLKIEPREVSKSQDNFVITFKWEAQYDFDLDSKFTSDPLEKTINRALHGPWNPHLKEKVEDVKIILHMWLALFYSKPSQQVTSSSRKVVEHSNPAKYVSINTVHDPLYEIADTDAVETQNGDESGPLRSYTRTQIITDVSSVSHEMKENHSRNQPVNLSVASKMNSKDYNIKLSSEIFQMYNQSSLSALYTNSLQTTVMCKMTSTSKVTPPPPNYLSANIPTMRYIDDRKQFNTELNANSEACVAIGGGSSGKALESVILLSDDHPTTLEGTKTRIISFELIHCEKSSMKNQIQDQTTGNMDLVPESNKEVESCTAIELKDCKDASVDLELKAKSVKDAKASSSTDEQIIEKRLEQSSDELEECQGELSLLDKNDPLEVTEIWEVQSGYCQENEHSYGSKIAAVENMGKLELSPSSQETSDVNDIDMCDVSKSGPDSPGKTEEGKSDSNENPDLVDISAEDPVAVFHQEDSRSHEDDEYQVNGNTEAVQVTDHYTEINGAEKIEESLPVHSQSPFPPRDFGSDRMDSLPAVSAADFQEKGTETIDNNFLQSDEVENIFETDDREDPPDNTQEVRPHISADILREEAKKCFVENSSLLASESSKAADLESLAKKSSLPLCKSSKAADLEKVGEESPLHGCESPKVADLQCIPVFETLSLKAVTEVYTTPISTFTKEQELELHDTENLPVEKEIMDNNLSVELRNLQTDRFGSCVLHTEDHMVPNTMEIGNSCETLQAPNSEELTEVTQITLVGKSESDAIAQDSNDTTNQPVSIDVDENLDLQPVDSQSDSTSDVVIMGLSPDQPERSNKDRTQSMRNRIRKEILSKLKRICRGSGIGQPTSSNSEDEVFIVHEKPGKWSTGEQKKQTDNKMVDLSNHEINAEGLAESTSKTKKKQAPIAEILEDKMGQEIANNPSIPSTEPVLVQEAENLASQEKGLSPLHDDFTDNIEQNSGQDQSEICLISNTCSISKEQYDLLLKTSDDNLEFIKAYKEPVTPKTSTFLRKESHELPSSPLVELASYPEPSHLRKAKHFKKHSGPSASQWEADEYVSRYYRDPDYPSFRSHGSFIRTETLKDVGKTWPTAHKEHSLAGRSDYDILYTDRKLVSNDLTQTTLDMEHLRFMCRLKEVLRKSSTDIQVSETPFQTIFDSRRIPGCSSSRPKCISPLLITVRTTTHRRRDYRGHDSLFPSSSYSQVSYENELRDKPVYYSRTSKKIKTRRSSPPYHFNRLRYESNLEKPNSDISVIIKECTQSNHQKLSRVGLGSTAVERSSACPPPEESGRQIKQTVDPNSTKSQTVGNIISDLCTNLRTKLYSVARDSAQKTCYFYLRKSDDDQDEDDDFFSVTKSLLIKDGYTPVEPQNFCDGDISESNNLLVIIRNENVSSQIHKIPRLLQLRLLPNVTFAGVDSPEDLSESMYQELLQTGGFVISDKTLLDNIPMGKLKDVLSVLEKMNRTSAWKWLIHYGEYRKLKEDKRAESFSRTKILLLKSYQQSNIIEILPYHQCDTRSKDFSCELDCLLSLQSQHIRSRLAVCLTVMPNTEAEAFEQNGFLVYDVDTFIRKIQKVDSHLQPSFWS